MLRLEGVSVVYLTKCHSFMLFLVFLLKREDIILGTNLPIQAKRRLPVLLKVSIIYLAGCGKKKTRLQ